MTPSDPSPVPIRNAEYDRGANGGPVREGSPPAAGTRPASESRRVFGRYRLERKLGEGGMAEVWEAFDPQSDRSVAIKVLKPTVEHDQDHRARFRPEIRAAAALLHPNVVTLFDVLEEAGVSAIVMELVDGPSLAELIERSGLVDQGRACRLLLQLADALGAVHGRGWVHRDLKPSNVLLSRDLATAKIADFGIAKIVDPEDATVAEATLLTGSGHRVGTPRYMAPEQIEGGPVDARTDLFALGAIAYEMLTGARAFDGPSFTAVSYRICNLEPRPLKALVPDLSEDLASAVTRLLCKRPEARFPSAQAFAAAMGPERPEAPAWQEHEEGTRRRYRPAQAWPIASGNDSPPEEYQEPSVSRWRDSFRG